MQIRVFNYNTHEKVVSLDAHADYIRSLAVHPNRPFVLSSSDDMTIKLWDWDQNWKNTMVCMEFSNVLYFNTIFN
jgi:coatomer subunit beta'